VYEFTTVTISHTHIVIFWPVTFSYTFKIWDPEAANKEREITIDVEYDAITTAKRRLSACLSIASAPLNQTGVPEPFWITGAKQSWIGEGEKKLFATNYVSAHASRTSCDEEGVKRCDLHMGKTQPGSWSSFKCKGERTWQNAREDDADIPGL
jgi:hypothetical protein